MAKEKTGSRSWRINLLLTFVFAISGIIFARLFYVSYVQHESLSKRAQSQYERKKESKLVRGEIFIQGGAGEKLIPVARTAELPYVYLVPSQSKNPDTAIKKLSELFPTISENEFTKMLSKKDDPFELVKKRVAEDLAAVINNLNLPEVKLGKESDRLYPQGFSLAQTVGFLGYRDEERAGQYGLEGYYDGLLEENANLVLTIDQNIQLVVEASLNDLMKKWSAASGTVMVQDPQTGAMLAMASSPSFDPNSYNQYSLKLFVNPAVQEVFEPGSSFKTITMAGGLDAEKVSPSSTYEDRGILNIGGYTIKNFDEKTYGIKNMTQVLEKSLNLGAVHVQKILGNDQFLNYVANFGFGKDSGIDLEGEAKGNISNLYTGREINFATAAFGQGIAVTPVQLINAYSAVANGGKLMKPYIVDEIIYVSGKRQKTNPKIVGVPIKEKTSAQLKSMLTSVVENGFDKAQVQGYDIAAKTGTAQIPGPGGYTEDFIHDMVGFAPSFSPRFTILIKLDKPKGIKFAADSLSPAFKNITKFLLNYYNIPPNPAQ